VTHSQEAEKCLKLLLLNVSTPLLLRGGEGREGGRKGGKERRKEGRRKKVDEKETVG